MIPGLSNIIKQDIDTFSNADFAKMSKLNHIDSKVAFAAIRLFSVGIMALGIIKAITGIHIILASGSIAKSALGVVYYVIAHDVFIIAKNMESLQTPEGAITAGLNEVLRQIRNYLNGQDITKINIASQKEAYARACTKDTFLPFITQPIIVNFNSLFTIIC